MTGRKDGHRICIKGLIMNLYREKFENWHNVVLGQETGAFNVLLNTYEDINVNHRWTVWCVAIQVTKPFE